MTNYNNQPHLPRHFMTGSPVSLESSWVLFSLQQDTAIEYTSDSDQHQTQHCQMDKVKLLKCKAKAIYKLLLTFFLRFRFHKSIRILLENC